MFLYVGPQYMPLRNVHPNKPLKALAKIPLKPKTFTSGNMAFVIVSYLSFGNIFCNGYSSRITMTNPEPEIKNASTYTVKSLHA